MKGPKTAKFSRLRRVQDIIINLKISRALTKGGGIFAKREVFLNGILLMDYRYRKNASHDQKKYSWHMRSKLYLPVTVAREKFRTTLVLRPDYEKRSFFIVSLQQPSGSFVSGSVSSFDSFSMSLHIVLNKVYCSLIE